ncbi:hypothetical protein WICPIJ_004709 [Wickerhamomyces pijperi]|uniref:PNPLA domain-containing protein n=1 Tax=Wickerhamomyces pijperi TaxID=599730 RepID=A0A9P8Q7L2_WICPI|nr:hypothetical protein WICPIJ_004709 [Wickerhamomyces pijperi]
MTQSLPITLLSTALNHIPPTVWLILDFLFDICTFWFRQLLALWRRKNPVNLAKQALLKSDNYNDWLENATYVDRLTGNDLWRLNFTSKKYDCRLISDRVQQLKHARELGDVATLVKVLRTGSFLRNFGGISNKNLFNRAYAGTKILIEDYISEVIKTLEYLDSTPLQSQKIHQLSSNQMKLDFFHEARQAFGSTALILQGGSLFGLCHIGVVKALYFKGLLPRIISGSAVGAVVAALVCVLTNDELKDTLETLPDKLDQLDRRLYKKGSVDERYGSVIENVITKGYSQDIFIFTKYVRQIIGDLTFEEAYIKTTKILNVVIHPTDPSIPTLLNHVTAPNVVIWSALYASIGSGVINEENCTLYIKDLQSRIVPFDPNTSGEPVRFLTPHQANERDPGTYESGKESPYTRLTELFNVNNFIVSLARPYLAPLLVNDIKHETGWRVKRLTRRLMGLELQHRMELLDRVGLLSSAVKRLAVDEKTPLNASEITIVPELRMLMRDFGRVFDVHRVKENINYWVNVGERSVWKCLPAVWVRCGVEFTLDDLYNKRRKRRAGVMY